MGMNGIPRDGVDLAFTYRKFATQEAAGNCAVYERLCLGVSGDSELLGLLETLPTPKRQPNLLLAPRGGTALRSIPIWSSANGWCGTGI